MRQKSTKAIVKRVIEIQKQLFVMKGLYRELDSLTDQLLLAKFKQGHGVKIVDNFTDKNVAFKTTAVKRFEVVPSSSIFNKSSIFKTRSRGKQ